jgi:hypothetical protein
MKKVTFKSRPGITGKNKIYTIVEYTQADDAAIRLRALALNWDLISIEPVKLVTAGDL